MAIGGGFVLDAEWYWRIFEGDATLGDEPAQTAARDFLRPLAGLARDRVVIDHIAIDDDGEGIRFRIAERPVAIACRGLSITGLVAAINRGLADAELDLVFAIVESRRYELRGVLAPRDEVQRARARGTIPP